MRYRINYVYIVHRKPSKQDGESRIQEDKGTVRFSLLGGFPARPVPYYECNS